MSRLGTAGLEQLLGDAAQRAQRYLLGLDGCSVAPGGRGLRPGR